MPYQLVYADACTQKTFNYFAGVLYAALVGANYKQAGESDTVNGTVAPAPGQRGYGILQARPRLADSFDISAPNNNWHNTTGGKQPIPWYRDARSAWYNGINRTIAATNFNLCQENNYTLVDPIAQSFFITGATVVLTKIDVYFRNKDSNLPVILEIRRNVNGYPGPEIIPFSTVVQQSYMVVTSEDATKPTTFVFDGLVHLEEGEYSLVLRTDSTNYKVWVSVQAEADVTTKNIINRQPYLGSFFQSQNLSTWTADQLLDLKFTIYRAEFNTTGLGVASFGIHPLHFKTLQLDTDPFEVIKDSKLVRVVAPGHGLRSGDNVIIDTAAFLTHPLVENVSNLKGLAKVLVANPYEFSIGANITANANVVTKPLKIGGDGITLVDSHHLEYDAIYPEVSVYAPKGTTDYGIGAGTVIIKTLDAASRAYVSDAVKFIPANEETIFDRTQVILNPASNNYYALKSNNVLLTNLEGYDTFNMVIPMISSDPLVSPLVDRKKVRINLIKNQIPITDFSSAHIMPWDQRLLVSNSYTANLVVTGRDTMMLRTTTANDAANLSILRTGSMVEILGSGFGAAGQSFMVLSSIISGSNANIMLKGTGVSNYYPNIAANIQTGNSISGIDLTYGSRFITDIAPASNLTKNNYITREIKFANKSTGILVRLDVCIPSPTTGISVYYRTNAVDENSAEINNKFWTGLPLAKLTVAENGIDFTEVTGAVNSLTEFTSMQLKIVYEQGRFDARTARVKNLRIICLA